VPRAQPKAQNEINHRKKRSSPPSRRRANTDAPSAEHPQMIQTVSMFGCARCCTRIPAAKPIDNDISGRRIGRAATELVPFVIGASNFLHNYGMKKFACIVRFRKH
jgi:hypothetical protein